MQLPRIAIPEINQNVTNYVNAVKAAGMEPVVISVRTENLEQNYQQEYLDYSVFRVSSFDGLVLPGGRDINPARYGQENKGSMYISDELDELQLSVLDNFVKTGRPVLGICRGYQLINVYFGGTLIQDIAWKERHTYSKETGDKVHRSYAKEGSWIAELYGTEFFHNSAHHQAVDKCGEGLEIVSRCPDDGIAEAFRHTQKEIYGVQWHPERMCLAHERNDTVCGFSIFQYFCRVCGGNPCEQLSRIVSQCRSEVMHDRMGL